MNFRISQKLNAKIKAGNLTARPRDDNPFADWSCHLFRADRTQNILLTNTPSLYSAVMYGQGIPNDSQFIVSALASIRDLMEDDGLAFVYHKLIVPASGTVTFAKALNRSVTGSMNDMIAHATVRLVEGEISPHDVGLELNDIPFSALKYSRPSKAFRNLLDADEP